MTSPILMPPDFVIGWSSSNLTCRHENKMCSGFLTVEGGRLGRLSKVATRTILERAKYTQSEIPAILDAYRFLIFIIKAPEGKPYLVAERIAKSVVVTAGVFAQDPKSVAEPKTFYLYFGVKIGTTMHGTVEKLERYIRMTGNDVIRHHPLRRQHAAILEPLEETYYETQRRITALQEKTGDPEVIEEERVKALEELIVLENANPSEWELQNAYKEIAEPFSLKEIIS